MLTPQHLNRVYKPETVLMVLIARIYFNKADKRQVQDFIDTNNIDWNLFYEIIRAHAVRPFIYHLILKEKLNTNAAFEQRLKGNILPLNLRHLHQKRHINSLLKELNQSGVKVIPYKGVTFGEAYYVGSALRESIDIDLLARKSDIKDIIDYLVQNNYQSQKFTDSSIKYQLATGRDIVFTTPPDAAGISCTLEIQWSLLKSHIGKFPDATFFMEQFEEVAGGVRLNPTYDFLALASHHFLQDMLTRFKFVIDIACIISAKGAEIDMEIVEKNMYSNGYKKIFATSMAAVNDLLGIQAQGFELPAPSHNPLVDSALKYPVINKIYGLEHRRLYISLQNNLWQKLKSLFRLSFKLIPTGGEIYDSKLPSYLFPLHFVIKPLRMVQRTLYKALKEQ